MTWVGGLISLHDKGKLKKKYSIQEIIELTQGQYGHKEFEEFFNDKN